MIDDLVMYAIFALDSYNGSDLPQLKVALTDGRLGAAIELDSAEFLPVDSASVGFYASAYEWKDHYVASYRGTLTQIFATEVINGYGVGAGLPAGPQAQRAIKFFQNLAVFAEPQSKGDERSEIAGLVDDAIVRSSARAAVNGRSSVHSRSCEAAA